MSNLCPKFTYDLCVLNEPYEYEASANHFLCCLPVTMLITPPSASVPNPTGTTPLYTSILSAKFTGMLFRSNDVPAPSCGIPSMNIFTCLPVNPSRLICMSEPTPPDSLTRIPGSFCRASLRFLVVFCSSFVSIATTLYAERFTLVSPVEATVSSSRFVTDGLRMTTSFCFSPFFICIVFSFVSKPMADTTSVYVPAGASKR